MTEQESQLRLKQIEQISKFLDKCEKDVLENKHKGGESSTQTKPIKIVRRMTY